METKKMKKQLFAIMFAISMCAVLSASTAYAQSQTIRAEVPFAFTANNKTLQAGSYQLESATDNRILWRIGSTDGQPADFLMALTRVGSASGKLTLTFHRYGDKYFLAAFKTPSYEIALPVTKAERKLRLEKGPLATMDMVRLETVTGISR